MGDKYPTPDPSAANGWGAIDGTMTDEVELRPYAAWTRASRATTISLMLWIMIT